MLVDFELLNRIFIKNEHRDGAALHITVFGGYLRLVHEMSDSDKKILFEVISAICMVKKSIGYLQAISIMQRLQSKLNEIKGFEVVSYNESDDHDKALFGLNSCAPNRINLATTILMLHSNYAVFVQDPPYLDLYDPRMLYQNNHLYLMHRRCAADIWRQTAGLFPKIDVQSRPTSPTP
jgi:hypothetical protein